MLTNARRAKAFIQALRDQMRERLAAQPIPGVRLKQSTRVLSDEDGGWVVNLATVPGHPRLTLSLWVDRWTEGPFRASLSVDGGFAAREHVSALARRLRPMYGAPIHRTDDDLELSSNGRTQWKAGRGFTEPMLAGRPCSYAHRGGGAGYGYYVPNPPRGRVGSMRASSPRGSRSWRMSRRPSVRGQPRAQTDARATSKIPV